jgi:hypothetical protein
LHAALKLLKFFKLFQECLDLLTENWDTPISLIAIAHIWLLLPTKALNVCRDAAGSGSYVALDRHLKLTEMGAAPIR